MVGKGAHFWESRVGEQQPVHGSITQLPFTLWMLQQIPSRETLSSLRVLFYRYFSISRIIFHKLSWTRVEPYQQIYSRFIFFLLVKRKLYSKNPTVSLKNFPSFFFSFLWKIYLKPLALRFTFKENIRFQTI